MDARVESDTRFNPWPDPIRLYRIGSDIFFQSKKRIGSDIF